MDAGAGQVAGRAEECRQAAPRASQAPTQAAPDRAGDTARARVLLEQAIDETRIGGRRPTRGGELTATERRLAELVAEGRSNNEVATALFVTPRTVETQRARIYRKLGIRSRTELARRLAREPDWGETVGVSRLSPPEVSP